MSEPLLGERDSVPVVGIGASAGGLDALQELLNELDPGLPFAFVVLQHIAPTHISMMTDLLGHDARLPVEAMRDGTQPAAGTVYVVPPNADAAIRDGRFSVRSPASAAGARPSINDFFVSLASDLDEDAIGVVLSGNGSDGTAGLRAIQGAGGITLVQEPSTAEYGSMPQSAIDSGVADFVLSPVDIAGKISELARLYRQGPTKENAPEHDVSERLLALLKKRRGTDFSGYKKGTVLRRLQRRLVATGCTDVDAYLDHVTQHPEELDALAKEILISVTSFFRDPQAFEALAKQIEGITEQASQADREIRVWVPGCATGEEAYSVAILFDEAFDRVAHRPAIQIFATDIDSEALITARRGVYPAAALAMLPEGQLTRHFQRVDHSYRVTERLRSMLVFAEHNLIGDPPFPRIDLIACRNVLIYFDSQLQSRILNRFHFALANEGILFLGQSETPASADSLFTAIDARERLFRKRGGTSTRLVPSSFKSLPKSSPAPVERDTEKLLEAVVSQLNATVALCELNGDIRHTAGEVERFFHFPRGKAVHQITDVIAQPFRNELFSLLHRMKQSLQPLSGRERDYAGQRWRLSLRPLPAPDPNRILVCIERLDEAGEHLDRVGPEVGPDENTAAGDDDVQSLMEELAKTNEEMQSLSEEAQASNEEFQATNEELHAANEELQASNEELNALNDALNAKTDQLQSLTDEYRHLYDAMEFPVLVFNTQGHLQRFNLAAKEILGLGSTSVGEPVDQLSLPTPLDDLKKDLDQARVEVKSDKKVIPLQGREWQQMVTPGCKEAGEVESLVVTLVEVTEIRRTRSELAASRAHLEALMGNSTILISSKGLDGRYQFANPAFLKAFDLSLKETLGRTDYELFPQPLAGGMWTTDLEVMRTGGAKVVEHEFDDGETRRIYRTTHQLLRDANGAPERLLIEADDVTARKRAEQKLRVAAQVFEQAGEAIMVTDANTVITSVNQAFTEITGYSAEEAIGSRVGELLRSGDNPSSLYKELWEGIDRQGFWRGELTNRRKNGELYPEWLTINRVGEAADIYYVAVFSDISKLKDSQKRAEYLATHDELTGLPNRSVFYDRLDIAMAWARRHERLVALIFLDLDDFKTVNDTLGHHVGDALLIEVSRRLTGILREVDTVSRLAGDEFTIILPDTSVVGAEHTAKRIIEALRQPFVVYEQRLFVTASIGIAFYPDDGTDVTTLIKAADMAMYRAKDNGRNRFEAFREELQAQLNKHCRVESALRNALQAEALQLAFHPQFDLVEGMPISSAEVLLRWSDPTLGVVSPVEFIAVAESSEMIIEIDRYVIERAIRAIAHWSSQGIPGVPLSINLSVRSLKDERMPGYLLGRLAYYGVTADQIQIEITEGALVDRTSVVIGNIEKLREASIPFAVDDFGTGYSSLSYLKRLPLAELKVDKSFVDGLGGNDRNDESIAQAILVMGQALGLRTVAEGVETETQLEWLKAHGCDRMQGFLYARPMSLEDFTKRLREHSP